jgi:hypothetical protein
VKDKCYEELQSVFDKFPKYYTIISLGDFNTEVAMEDIFEPTTGNDSLRKIRNDNGVGIVNFATSKNLTVRSTTLPHRTFINLLAHLLMERLTIRLTRF